MAFGYYTTFTVNPGQVPSTQTDFPVVIRPIDNRFRDIANGGHVQSSSGYDIRPYADSAASTALKFELVVGSYDNSNGAFEMWIKIPSLSNGYVIYLFYGDPTINTNGTSTDTWRSEFKEVMHYPNIMVFSLDDSTSNANNGTNHFCTPSSGKIDGGIQTSNGAWISTAFGIGTPSSITYSCWCNPSTQGAQFVNYLISLSIGAGFSWSIFAGGSLDLGIGLFDGTNIANTGTGTFTDADNNVWTKIDVAYDNAASPKTRIYKNGVSLSISSPTITGSVAANDGINIGRRADNNFYWPGNIDEVHVLTGVANPSDWITTEYNNQNNPSSYGPAFFMTMGAEQQPAAGGQNIDSNILIGFTLQLPAGVTVGGLL